jgi:hypothetical protein
VDAPIYNGTITETFLGVEPDVGVITGEITIKYGKGIIQKFGGLCLKDQAMSRFVVALVEALKLHSWEEVNGKYVRIKVGSNGLIKAIGHIVEDSWLDLDEHGAKGEEADREVAPKYYPPPTSFVVYTYSCPLTGRRFVVTDVDRARKLMRCKECGEICMPQLMGKMEVD